MRGDSWRTPHCGSRISNPSHSSASSCAFASKLRELLLSFNAPKTAPPRAGLWPSSEIMSLFSRAGRSIGEGEPRASPGTELEKYAVSTKGPKARNSPTPAASAALRDQEVARRALPCIRLASRERSSCGSSRRWGRAAGPANGQTGKPYPKSPRRLRGRGAVHFMLASMCTL